jgi:hypothetical protein
MLPAAITGRWSLSLLARLPWNEDNMRRSQPQRQAQRHSEAVAGESGVVSLDGTTILAGDGHTAEEATR